MRHRYTLAINVNDKTKKKMPLTWMGNTSNNNSCGVELNKKKPSHGKGGVTSDYALGRSLFESVID